MRLTARAADGGVRAEVFRHAWVSHVWVSTVRRQGLEPRTRGLRVPFLTCRMRTRNDVFAGQLRYYGLGRVAWDWSRATADGGSVTTR